MWAEIMPNHAMPCDPNGGSDGFNVEAAKHWLLHLEELGIGETHGTGTRFMYLQPELSELPEVVRRKLKRPLVPEELNADGPRPKVRRVEDAGQADPDEAGSQDAVADGGLMRDRV